MYFGLQIPQISIHTRTCTCKEVRLMDTQTNKEWDLKDPMLIFMLEFMLEWAHGRFDSEEGTNRIPSGCDDNPDSLNASAF